MSGTKRTPLSPAEQTVLDHLPVRPLTGTDDLARCAEFIVQEHYLHEATLVGEHLRYVATYQGRWLAVANLGVGLLSLSRQGIRSSAGRPRSAGSAVPSSPTMRACWCWRTDTIQTWSAS